MEAERQIRRLQPGYVSNNPEWAGFGLNQGSAMLVENGKMVQRV
jgi:hypothetical protein